MNIRVPEDVQVIGFDGVQTFGDGDYFCSTIVQPIQDIADMCVELLLQENTSSNSPLACFPVLTHMEALQKNPSINIPILSNRYRRIFHMA